MSWKVVMIAGAFVLLSSCSQIDGLIAEPTATNTPTPTITPTPTLAPTPTPQPLPEEILALLEGWAEGQEEYAGFAIQAGEAGWEVVIERVDGGEAIGFQIEHWGEGLSHPDFPNAGWVLVDEGGEVRWLSYPDAKGKLRWMERISAKDILARAVQRIDISVPLVGTVFIEGEEVNLNFPDLQPQITVMLDPTNAEPYEGTYPALAVKEIGLATEWYQENLPEGSAELQFAVEMLYMHYHAWRWDKDGDFFEEREDVSFTDWLAMLESGETDGGHDLRLNMDASDENSYAESKKRVKALDTMIIVAGDYTTKGAPFEGGSLNFRDDFAYDPTLSSFIIVADERLLEGYLPLSKPANEVIFPYFGLISSQMAIMANPERYQYGERKPENATDNMMLKRIRNEISKILMYEDWGDYYFPPILFFPDFGTTRN